MNQEHKAEAQELAATIQPLLDYSTVLELLQESVKDAYLAAESKGHDGALVGLDSESAAIWNEAVRIAFNRQLQSNAYVVPEVDEQ
jgi:hypothetical protein